mgnify:CR=1 FL=1
MSTEEINSLRTEFTRSLDRLTDTITEKFDEDTKRLEKLAIQQAEQARDITHGRCPQPGACIGVAESVRKLEDRITPIENAFREAQGERRARLAVGAAISAGAGLLGALAPYIMALLQR